MGIAIQVIKIIKNFKNQRSTYNIIEKPLKVILQWINTQRTLKTKEN